MPGLFVILVMKNIHLHGQTQLLMTTEALNPNIMGQTLTFYTDMNKRLG
jgi:hypothetical protein